ncbi:MAG: DUF805 domain-containing protein [Planctomycetota bacterium]|jgi:hypothetical protein
MSAGNRSPLGFGPIILFHLCVICTGVLLQNAHAKNPQVFLGILGLGLGVGAWAGWTYRGFLWDLFRNFKSAATLITLLVLACILGTFILQDLDQRRAGVFSDPKPGADGLPEWGKNQPTQFMVAESHGWLWLSPTDERKKLTKEKVVLSPIEERQVALREQAYGQKSARAYAEAVLGSKQRSVDDMTTRQFAREHRKGLYAFYKWCGYLHLIDIFEAWWFYMLLGLIAVNVIVGTFARAPWTARDFGVAITHAGILIVLGGALLDVLVAKEGYIHFVYGRPAAQISGKIQDDKNRVYHHLPFRVELKRFATEYYHELLVTRVDWSRRADGSAFPTDGGPHGTPFNVRQNFAIREGLPLTFEGGEIEVVVHAYKPRVFVETDVVEKPEGPPAAQIAIYRDAAGGRNLLAGAAPTWLFADGGERSHIELGDLRLEYLFAGSTAEYDSMLKKAPVPDNGSLVMRVGDEQERLRVMLGGKQTISLGGKSFQVEFNTIRSALADAENVNLDRRLQRSEEPVLWARINGREIRIPRDDSAFTRDFKLLQGVEFRFDWPNPKDRGVFSIYRLLAADGRPPVLVQADYNGAASVHRLQRGSPVALTGRLDGFYFDVTRALRNAAEQRAIREVTDEQFLEKGGGGRDHLLAAWADIEIKGPQGTVRKEITPFDGPVRYGDDGHGRPTYWFEVFKTSMALDWFSVLTAVDHEGNELKSHNVQVNSPLRYGGYRFFQATAATTPDGLSVSGISVTYNPGVIFMYIGYYVLTLGVCYIFFLRPIIDNDRRNGGVLFSFTGRIDRATFWKSTRTMVIIDVIAIAITILLGSVGVLWFFILFWWIPTIWPRLALHVKRSHDVNRSGWFLLVPVLGAAEGWAMKSFPEDNEYGPVPVGSGAKE